MLVKMFNIYLSVFGSFLVVVFAIEFKHSSSIKNVELIAKPLRAKVGEPVQLDCSYDLDGIRLYSVKFYHKQKEFFRYMPAENGCSQEFHSSNFKVKQRGISIEIEPLDEDASGIYQCEVSTDAPIFETATVQQNIAIIPSEPAPIPKLPFVELKITPTRPTAGESVKLEWTYDVDSEIIYSFKIYKDTYEFYRYLPNDSPAAVFSVPGVTVERSSISNTSIVLSSVTSETSGFYMCEISTKAPLFTIVRSSKMLLEVM